MGMGGSIFESLSDMVVLLLKILGLHASLYCTGPDLDGFPIWEPESLSHRKVCKLALEMASMGWRTREFFTLTSA
jgi:hypothetical protein